MQTKFNIGEVVYIYDITKGIVEGIITQIHTQAQLQHRDSGYPIALNYTTRYTIESATHEYDYEPEHTIYRSRKELTEVMFKMLKEDETE
jgi:hypothetical protein